MKLSKIEQVVHVDKTVIEVDTITEVVSDPWPEPPRLLVEWSSPWEEFKTAFGPALTRAPKALAGEAPVGIFPYRGLLLAWFSEFVLMLILIILPDQLAKLNPGPLPPRPTWDVIYYSGAELPQTADQGGAQLADRAAREDSRRIIRRKPFA